MKKILLILLPIVSILTGCGDELPNCASEESTKLVKSIYWDAVSNQLAVIKKSADVAKRSMPQDVEALKKVVSLELSSIEQSTNKNKDKFTCKAKVTLTPSADGKALMTFVEKGGDASETALMVILMGAGKDYTDPANRKAGFTAELFDQAAKMLLAAPLMNELTQDNQNAAMAAFTQNLAGAVIGGAVGAYAGSEIGPQSLQLLAAAMEDIESINTKEGVYISDVQYTSSSKKIDDQNRHFVEAKFNEKEVIFPLDLYLIGDKFKKGNERLAVVAKQIAGERAKQIKDASPAPAPAPAPELVAPAAPAPAPAPAPAVVPETTPTPVPRVQGTPEAPPVANTKQPSALNKLDGSWYSEQWKYGYDLKDGVGIATSSNSPKFKPGDKIINLTASGENVYQGEQIYTDGKFYKVNATLQPDGTLAFVGEKNAKWVMKRIR